MTIGNRPGALALALLFALTSAPVAAAAPAESPWRVGVAVGYGQRGNPLINSEDIDLAVDVDIAWFGERFFFDNGDAGWTWTDSDRGTLNLVARINSDRVFFSHTDTRLLTLGELGAITGVPVDPTMTDEVVRVEVPDRDYAVELGMEYLTDGPWGNLQMALHHDVSGAHGGFEAYLDYGYGVGRGRWYVELSGGGAYKNSALNDYYWGVREAESSPVLPAYRAGAGVNVHARLFIGYRLTRRWTALAVTELERLDSESADSPIVADHTVAAFFAGFGYRF